MIIFPTVNEMVDKIAETPMQITAIPTQKAVGYIEISNDFPLKNQLSCVKNKECNQLNMLLKSAIAQTAKITKPIKIINPDHIKARPNALRPQKTNNKIKNIMAPTRQIPKAIFTFANNDLTSCK